MTKSKIKIPPSKLLSSSVEEFLPSGRISAQLLQGIQKLLAPESVVQVLAEGISTSSGQIISILAAARCALALPELEPTTITIARLLELSRNTVSQITATLESLGVVSIKNKARSKLVIPTKLGDFYSEVATGNFRLSLSLLQQIDKTVKELPKEFLDDLEDLETAFDLGKRMFSRKTLNYEISDELHDKVVQLVASLREARKEASKEQLKELIQILQRASQLKEKAEKLGLRPAILEYADESWGRARIFRAK